jgi:hypothetical protein
MSKDPKFVAYMAVAELIRVQNFSFNTEELCALNAHLRLDTAPRAPVSKALLSAMHKIDTADTTTQKILDSYGAWKARQPKTKRKVPHAK